ncbi:hypothetical protein PG990_000651 [Apiospora arundinis]
MEGSRPSTEADRKLESGTATSPADDNDGGLHPALYIALWISLNSSVILFNKWVLASAKFSRLPHVSDNMAHGLLHSHDPNHGVLHYRALLETQGAHERRDLSPRYLPYWYIA